MIYQFIGLNEEMPIECQDAVNALTAKRYATEIFSIENYLREDLRLPIGTRRYQKELDRCHHLISESLAQMTKGTLVSALFVEQSSKLLALGAMRSNLGTRHDRPISATIGDPASSLPTHSLLQGFQYSSSPGWDPDKIVEAQISVPTRLVKQDKRDLHSLRQSGRLSEPEFEYLLRYGFKRIYSSTFRCTQQILPNLEGFLLNTVPAVAIVLRRDIYIDIQPLRSNSGIEPTPFALSHNLHSLYFGRHRKKYAELFQSKTREWSIDDHDIREASVSLPFIIRNDESLNSRMKKVEVEESDSWSIQSIRPEKIPLLRREQRPPATPVRD